MLTDEYLDAIDAIISLPLVSRKTHCVLPHPEIDLLDPMLRELGFISYANITPYAMRKVRERSLWLRRADNRCVPELYVLASLKVGILSLNMRPFWLDADWTNNCVDNIGIAYAEPLKREPKTAQERFFADPVNKHIHRQRMRERAAREREILKRAKEAVGKKTLKELASQILPPDGRVGPDDDRAFGHSVEAPDDSDLFIQLEQIAEAKLQQE